MKNKLLAAVASFAFVATGVAAMAQDNPKDKERPAAERMEPKAPAAAPKAEAAPKAAQMERQEPKGQEHMKGQPPMKGEAPKAAETERKEAPKAAQTERKEMKGGAEPGKEAPKAAQTQERKDGMKSNAQTPENRTAEPAQQRPATRTGAKDVDGKSPRTAERPEGRGQVKAMGKVKMSNEHAVKVGEALRRDARPQRVDIDIRVGVRVPEQVEIRPLPTEIVTIVPEYRGFDYFIDSDDEIVFVSPETHEIVGTIQYEGRAASEDATHVRAAKPCPVED